MRTLSRTRELEVLERVRAIPEGFVQRALLAAEGVPFRGRRVDMSRARLAD